MAVIGLKKWAVVAVLALAVDTGWAMQRPGAPPANHNSQQENSRDGMERGPRMHGPGPHVGDWLRRHQGMSWDEQEHALERDPQFQRLNPKRQDRLVE
jgi:hypothetical protein